MWIMFRIVKVDLSDYFRNLKLLDSEKVEKADENLKQIEFCIGLCEETDKERGGPT